MKSRIAILVSLLNLLPVAGFAARGGDGVRGGGEAVRDINGNYRLLDEVTPSKCKYVTSEELVYGNQARGIRGNSTLQTLFAKIEEIDWYIGFELRRERQSLFYCLTDRLRRMPIKYDLYGVVYEKTIPVLQAMYRDGRYVYIDQGIDKKMNDRSRAFYFMHELLHSYIPTRRGETYRYQQLRSLVMAFGELLDGNISNRNELYFQLAASDSVIPRVTNSIDKHKNQVLIYLDVNQQLQTHEWNDRKLSREERYKPTLTQIENLLKTPESGSVFASDLKYLANHLSSWDAEVLYPDGPNAGSAAAEILRSAIAFGYRNGDDSLVRKLINRSNNWFTDGTVIDTAAIGLINLEHLSYSMQTELMQSANMRTVIQEELKPFLSASVVAKYNILPDASLAKILGATTSQPVIEIETLPETSLITEFKPIIYIISQLLKVRRYDLLDVAILENPIFYDALGLKKAKTDVRSIEVPIAREREKALKQLNILSINLVKRLLKNLNYFRNVDNEGLEHFRSRVVLEKFI